MKYKKICKKNDYDPDDDEKEKKKENKGTTLATTSYPRFKGRCYTSGNFGHKSADCPNKKNDSEIEKMKKGKDLTEDVCIVEDGITNALTAGATKRSRKDKKNNGKSANVTSEKKQTKI